MQFSEVLGHAVLKNELVHTIKTGRIPHAQLFLGQEGVGTLPMALAYASAVIKHFSTDVLVDKRLDNLVHPDLHFVFPVAANKRVKSKPKSDDFLDEFRAFIKEQPYGNLYDWYQSIDVENKQGQIGVEDALHIGRKLSVKAYEGGWKVVLFWMAEKMNAAAANKLLKLVEEPPEKTLLLFVVEEEEAFLETLLSRCQMNRLSPLSDGIIREGLINKGCSETLAKSLGFRAHGSFNRALDLWRNNSEEQEFEQWFVSWVRAAFQAKKNKGVVLQLVEWSKKMAGLGRETQKQFLAFCLEFFRQSLLQHYGIQELVYYKPQTDFNLPKFAPYVNANNIFDIVKSLEEAHFHIERNGNARLIFTDLSLQLTRFIHR